MIKKLFIFLLLFTSVALAYLPSIDNFNSGKVSRLMEARAGFEKYQSSSRTIENMLVTALGPVIKRPGTKYIATAGSGKVRLFPYEYSTDDAYVLEMGNVYTRFYRDGGQILDGSDDPVEITTVFDTDEIWDIQYAMTDDEMYLVDGTDPPQILTRSSHTSWTIADVTFEKGPFLKTNTTSTTITPTEIGGGGFAASASITLTASSAIFQKTSGASHVDSIWAIEQVRSNSEVTGTFTANGISISSPNFSGAYSFVTTDVWQGLVSLQRSTNNGISWRNALVPTANTNYDNTAETEDDGAIYRVVMSNYSSGTCNYTFTITEDVNKAVVEITAVASTTSATATVITDLIDNTATTTWREPYWSDYRGWPTTVAFYQQRLVFGGSRSYPQTLWFGKQDPDDYANFLEGPLDTDAFTAALEGQNPIRWMLNQDFLLIGTSGSCGKWGEQGKPSTPTSPAYQEQTRHGSAAIRAVYGGDSVIYIERGSRKVREFAFSFQVDKYIAPALTVLSPEITESGIVDIAFQLRPDPILWCVLNNGEIATLTYQKDQAVVAWTKQITDGDFESVAVISSGESEDEVWVSVKRTINGTTARYIEQFQPLDWGSDDDDAWFVDSGLGYDSTATASFSGLDHLEGETLNVYADGIIQEDETVIDGEITIDRVSSVVTVGLPYTAKLETLPIRVDPQDYTMNKKIKRMWCDLYKTGKCFVGNGPNSTLTEISFSDGATLDPVSELFTSDVKLKNVPWVYSGMRKQTVFFLSDDPVPLGIRAILPDMEIRR